MTLLTRLQKLLDSVKELQTILLKVATSESTWQEKDERYRELCREIDLEIEDLHEEGLSICKLDLFSSLKAAKDYLFRMTQQYSQGQGIYARRRRYIFELFSDLITEIEDAMYYAQHGHLNNGNETIDVKEKLQGLVDKIQELREIMIDVAVHGRNLDYEDAGYTKLYQESCNLVRDLNQAGVPISNPNPFRYIWHWHSYWDQELKEKPERQAFVDSRYEPVINAIEQSLHRHQSRQTTEEELINDLKQRLQSQNTSAPQQTASRSQAITPESQISQLNLVRRRWALLVGVNRYTDPIFSSLKFCVDDVLALEQLLTKLGYTVVCLHDRLDRDSHLYPTKNNVEAQLIRLCLIVQPDDLLLVHFSCHGKLDQQKPFLVLRDTRLSTLSRSSLPLLEVQQQMRQSKAKRLVLFLDACHTGVEMGRSIDDSDFIRNAYELAQGFALLAASTSQQIAQEDPDKQHGIFTYYLLEGLQGKADRTQKKFVTVDDLKNHTLDALQRWIVQKGGIIQEPTARTEGFGDMILADYRDMTQSEGEDN